MKKWTKAALVCALTGCMTLPTFSVSAAGSAITTTATGYTSAAEVVYETGTLVVDGKNRECVQNWGARGEDCTFLSKYASSYYQGSSSYKTLSLKEGNSARDNVPNSDLYKALSSAMKATYTYKTTGSDAYGETRYWYCYTDCVRNDEENFSSFYSGGMHDSTWVSGNSSPWNREHAWPKSKGLGGQDENEIAMLRPTLKSENSSRGNKAYGESSGYFDPNNSLSNFKTDRGVRGDCARIVLFNYTRWGNTSKMWGTAGVMESVDILLKWMEEDPVDTWEMGRNDAVQSITGTRNIFVDYPEYAWLLFDEEIPSDMVTPSGIAKGAEPPADNSSSSGGDVDVDSSSSSGVLDKDSAEASDDTNGESASDSANEGSSENQSAADQNSGNENSTNGGSIADMLTGCQGSVSGIAAYVTLAMASAFVLKRRSK